MAEEKACKGILSWQHTGNRSCDWFGTNKSKEMLFFPSVALMWPAVFAPVQYLLSNVHKMYTLFIPASCIHKHFKSKRNIVEKYPCLLSLIPKWTNTDVVLQDVICCCFTINSCHTFFPPEMILRLFALCFTPAPRFLCMQEDKMHWKHDNNQSCAVYKTWDVMESHKGHILLLKTCQPCEYLEV